MYTSTTGFPSADCFSILSLSECISHVQCYWMSLDTMCSCQSYSGLPGVDSCVDARESLSLEGGTAYCSGDSVPDETVGCGTNFLVLPDENCNQFDTLSSCINDISCMWFSMDFLNASSGLDTCGTGCFTYNSTMFDTCSDFDDYLAFGFNNISDGITYVYQDDDIVCNGEIYEIDENQCNVSNIFYTDVGSTTGSMYTGSDESTEQSMEESTEESDDANKLVLIQFLFTVPLVWLWTWVAF